MSPRSGLFSPERTTNGMVQKLLDSNAQKQNQQAQIKGSPSLNNQKGYNISESYTNQNKLAGRHARYTLTQLGQEIEKNMFEQLSVTIKEMTEKLSITEDIARKVKKTQHEKVKYRIKSEEQFQNFSYSIFKSFVDEYNLTNHKKRDPYEVMSHKFDLIREQGYPNGSQKEIVDSMIVKSDLIGGVVNTLVEKEMGLCKERAVVIQEAMNNVASLVKDLFQLVSLQISDFRAYNKRKLKQAKMLIKNDIKSLEDQKKHLNNRIDDLTDLKKGYRDKIRKMRSKLMNDHLVIKWLKQDLSLLSKKHEVLRYENDEIYRSLDIFNEQLQGEDIQVLKSVKNIQQTLDALEVKRTKFTKTKKGMEQEVNLKIEQEEIEMEALQARERTEFRAQLGFELEIDDEPEEFRTMNRASQTMEMIHKTFKSSGFQHEAREYRTIKQQELLTKLKCVNCGNPATVKKRADAPENKLLVDNSKGFQVDIKKYSADRGIQVDEDSYRTGIQRNTNGQIIVNFPTSMQMLNNTYMDFDIEEESFVDTTLNSTSNFIPKENSIVKSPKSSKEIVSPSNPQRKFRNSILVTKVSGSSNGLLDDKVLRQGTPYPQENNILNVSLGSSKYQKQNTLTPSKPNMTTQHEISLGLAESSLKDSINDIKAQISQMDKASNVYKQKRNNLEMLQKKLKKLQRQKNGVASRSGKKGSFRSMQSQVFRDKIRSKRSNKTRKKNELVIEQAQIIYSNVVEQFSDPEFNPTESNYMRDTAMIKLIKKIYSKSLSKIGRLRKKFTSFPVYVYQQLVYLMSVEKVRNRNFKSSLYSVGVYSDIPSIGLYGKFLGLNGSLSKDCFIIYISLVLHLKNKQ